MKSNLWVIVVFLVGCGSGQKPVDANSSFGDRTVVDVTYIDRCADGGDCTCESPGNLPVTILGTQFDANKLMLSTTVGTLCNTHNYRISGCEQDGSKHLVVVHSHDCGPGPTFNDGVQEAVLRLDIPAGVTDVVYMQGAALIVK